MHNVFSEYSPPLAHLSSVSLLPCLFKQGGENYTLSYTFLFSPLLAIQTKYRQDFGIKSRLEELARLDCLITIKIWWYQGLKIFPKGPWAWQVQQSRSLGNSRIFVSFVTNLSLLWSQVLTIQWHGIISFSTMGLDGAKSQIRDSCSWAQEVGNQGICWLSKLLEIKIFIGWLSCFLYSLFHWSLFRN